LFSLGADVVISKLLKKSAREALDAKAFTPNKGVDQTQYNEMIKTLEGLAGVKVVDEALEIDWMRRMSRPGALGGRILNVNQIKLIRQLLKQKYGIDLIVEGSINAKNYYRPIGKFKTPKELFAFMNSSLPKKVGGFNAATKQFLLTENATELMAFHELAHVKHFHTLGEEAYKKLNKLDKEMNVWNKIYKSKDSWTVDELEDALRYINDIRTNPNYGFNLEPIILD